ncbi:hypothetical protein DFQ27_007521 [Actinomortierella ambigua]|uniref:Uncharacterized protein n=1 Tax=Actinomortierella ambigua TaxID=1343610 RepID=A0A9P6TZZ6_9FUNG|nr:hypothetical protein DFQ27_007521 [Actinomortierella ambigua]
MRDEFRFEAITFDDASNIEEQALQMAKPTKFSHDLELEQARKSASHLLAVEFGWASAVGGRMSQTSLGSSTTSTITSFFGLLEDDGGGSHHLVDPFLSPSNEHRRRITLNDEHMHDDDDLMRRNRDRAFGLSLGDEELLGGAGDGGLYFDAEGNLLAIDDPALPHAPGISARAAGKRRKLDEDGDSNNNIGGVVDGASYLETDQALYDDNLFDLDLGGVCDDQQPFTPAAATAGRLLVGDDGIVPTLNVQSPPTGNSPKRLKSGIQSWRRMMDDPTMLTREEIQQARADFLQEQKRTSSRSWRQQQLDRMREQLDGFLNRPMSLHDYGSDLVEFWTKVATKTPLPLPPPSSSLLVHGLSAEAGPSNWHKDMPPPTTTMLGDGDDMMPPPLLLPGHDFDDSTDDEPELVRRRRHHLHAADSAASSSAASASAVSSSPLDGSGVGASLIMPWDLQQQQQHGLASGSHSGSSNSGGGGSDRGKERVMSDFERAFDEAGPVGGGSSGSHRHRRWPRSGTSTPTGRQSRTSSPQRRTAAAAATASTPAGAMKGGMDWALLFGDDGGSGVGATTPPPFEGLWTDEGASSSDGTEATLSGMATGVGARGHDHGVGGSGATGVVAAAAAGESTLVDPQGYIVMVERETASFLRYIQSILRDAKASSFHFSDVVATHQKRAVAAAAFYHILEPAGTVVMVDPQPPTPSLRPQHDLTIFTVPEEPRW